MFLKQSKAHTGRGCYVRDHHFLFPWATATTINRFSFFSCCLPLLCTSFVHCLPKNLACQQQTERTDNSCLSACHWRSGGLFGCPFLPSKVVCCLLLRVHFERFWGIISIIRVWRGRLGNEVNKLSKLTHVIMSWLLFVPCYCNNDLFCLWKHLTYFVLLSQPSQKREQTIFSSLSFTSFVSFR